LEELPHAVPADRLLHEVVDTPGWHDWHAFPGFFAPFWYNVPLIRQAA
jgi:hypothetical protein